MYKLNFHSIVDVITNSSTVIYTYQDCEKEAKELLQEVLNIAGNGEKVEDVFIIGVFLNYPGDYFDYVLDRGPEEREEIDIPKEVLDMGWKEQVQYVKDLIVKIMNKEIEKPQWMIDEEERENWACYKNSTSLYIKAKDMKYMPLVQKALRFLNAPNHEATRDG